MFINLINTWINTKYITKITAFILFCLIIWYCSPHDFTDFHFLNSHKFFWNNQCRKDLAIMCRCFFLQNNLIGPKVCENLEFLQKWGEQERPIPYFLYPHRDYDSSRESIQLQKVLAFCDFWFQRVIMKCGDHEFRGLVLV